MPSRRFAPALLAASALAGALPAAAMEVREFRRDGWGGTLTAGFRVAAPPDQVFETLTDDTRFAEFMPFVTECRALERFPGGAKILMRARQFGMFDFSVVYIRRYRADRRQVTWQEVGGFFKRDDGAWTLAPDGAGTRVTYEIILDPGFYVPGFLLEFGLRQGLPEIGESVRRRAESGGRWKRPK
ncbi:MAG: SRPBCC family protein [Candidatus Sericytochromatia bacterium]|nr:SRPBCC family protein [Candidatus Tanganyikabacteria bacterium]